MKKTITVILLLFLCCNWANAFDYSIGITGGYNEGNFGIGYNKPPLGTAKDSDIPFSIIGRVTYNKYQYQPTIELTYKRSRYNVDTTIACNHLEPEEISIRTGITKEISGLELILLAGLSHLESNLYVTQHMKDGKWMPHGAADGLTGGNMFNTVSFRVGFAKNIKISNIKTGIETGIEWFPQSRKIQRCMTFETNSIEPYIGLHIKF